MRSRPVSAGKSLSTAPPTSAHPKSRTEQALLHKIGLLADHHAKNVQALHALRSTSTPPTAWASVADPPPPYESVSPGRTRKRVPNDEYLYKMNDGRSTRQPPSRVFTRVVTCSDRSPLRNKPTVVEPFPGMETHATAWKRKMRQYEEVGQKYVSGHPGSTDQQLSLQCFASGHAHIIFNLASSEIFLC